MKERKSASLQNWGSRCKTGSNSSFTSHSLLKSPEIVQTQNEQYLRIMVASSDLLTLVSHPNNEL